MLPDAATVARHPALAEFLIEQLRNRCATLEAALQREFAEPMPPEHITDTDVARVYRRVYGGPRFGSAEREFAEEIARLRDRQWKAAPATARAALAQQPQALEFSADAI